MHDITEYCADRLPELLRLLQGSDLLELVIQDGDRRVRIVRSPGSVPGDAIGLAEAPEGGAFAAEPGFAEIRSPVVGTFYRAGKLGMAPLVSEGSEVEEDTVVGIVESLQQLTDIEAGHIGMVTRVLATDGQPVEYGQVLFEVTPRG
jgi:acetyl-CoA carboxylase biotin carboxyl carrier protein